MRRRFALLSQMMALAQPRFIFGMYGHAPLARHEGRQNVLVAIKEKRARRGAEKGLHASDAGRAFKRTKRADVLRRSTHIERVIAMHAPLRPRELFLQRKARRRRRICVGHLENRRDPAEYGGTAAAFEILLVFVARLAEVHLGINDARENMQSARLETPGRRRAGKLSDRSDPSVTDSDIRFRNSVRRGDRATADEKV